MLIREFQNCILVIIGNDTIKLDGREAMYKWLAENGYKTWDFEFDSCIYSEYEG